MQKDAIVTYKKGSGTWRPDAFSKDRLSMYVRDGRGDYQLVTNATISPRSWFEMDERVRAAAEPISNVYKKLRDEGLLNTDFGVGAKVAAWDVDDERTEAAVSVNGDKIEFEDEDPKTQKTVVPVIQAGFKVGWRTIAGLEGSKSSLIKRGPANASRAVAKKREKLLLNGDKSASFDGEKVMGFLNAKGSLRANPADISSDILTTSLTSTHDLVLSVLERMSDRGFYGPFGVFMGEKIYQHLLKIHDDGTGASLGSRIEEIKDIKWLERSHFMEKDSLSFVMLDPHHIEIIEELALQTQQYGSPLNMSESYVVKTVVAPGITVSHRGYSALAHIEKCFG